MTEHREPKAQELESSQQQHHDTRIVPIDCNKIGRFVFTNSQMKFLDDWDIELSEKSSDAAYLVEAASRLRTSNVPVAFPTETVYGLGADATRTSAVLGIYAAKQRPSDNPLIVHISSLSQLRELLLPPRPEASVAIVDAVNDPIPSIYYPLILRFWPGPLTILLPLPTPSPFATPVTASLKTFGARMPSSPLALALIHLANVPVAAPSANTSTKPSPTTAAHVLQDLAGRIDLILDGGSCDVGLESTVVDGLVQPPVILRPGGVSIEMIKECSGWEDVVVSYNDRTEAGPPKAPGMKYRHYSPRARVVLVEGRLEMETVKKFSKEGGSVGIIGTKKWRIDELEHESIVDKFEGHEMNNSDITPDRNARVAQNAVSPNPSQVSTPTAHHSQVRLGENRSLPPTDVWAIRLGPETAEIARGLFAALRELDMKRVDTILVESINDHAGDAAAAVMNRLRKAAEVELKP